MGFRTSAVHDYRSLNLEVVRSIIETQLTDFREFREAVLKESVDSAVKRFVKRLLEERKARRA